MRLRCLFPVLPAIAACGSAAAGATDIVGPLDIRTPRRTTEHDPSAGALIETWLAASRWPATKRFDQERYEIRFYRVVWARAGRAALHVRLLPLAGSAETLAAARCPGRTSPIEVQLYYEWSADLGSWTSVDARGDPGFAACPEAGAFWTAEEMATLVDPPALPVPPRVDPKDVVTPPPGSADRAALLDAVRPIDETLFGKPIKFRVQSMRVAAGFAFMSVHPERPNGVPIERRTWDKAVHDCEHTPDSVMHEYWMKKVGKTWTIGLRNDVCADDSIAWDGDIVGAPPALAGKANWEERLTYPLEAIKTGIAH